MSKIIYKRKLHNDIIQYNYLQDNNFGWNVRTLFEMNQYHIKNSLTIYRPKRNEYEVNLTPKNQAKLHMRCILLSGQNPQVKILRPFMYVSTLVVSLILCLIKVVGFGEHQCEERSRCQGPLMIRQ